MMRPSRSVTPFLRAMLTVSALVGCQHGDGGKNDAAPVSGDADVRVDTAQRDADGADGQRDEDGGFPSGPLTQVAYETTVVVDRICDIDGNGSLDNAMADLGPAQGPIAAATFNSFLGNPRDTFLRWIFHFPWIDRARSRDDADTTLIFVLGEDFDDPRDVSNDFTGEGVFLVRGTGLDACREPRSAFPSATVEDGRVETEEARDLWLDIGAGTLIATRGARLSGTIEDGGVAGEWLLCGALTIDDLGLATVHDVDVGDLSLLEAVLGGGRALGVPSVPGVSPDLDIDGDGLERIDIDEQSRIVRCVDGDLSTIEGRDCWRDDRMADALSINMRFRAVSASLGGFVSSWADSVEGECTDPPEESLWDAP